MLRLLPLLALLLFPQPTPLVRFRDKARPLLLFTPSGSDRRFLAQVHALEADTSALADRQIVVLVFREHPGTWRRPAGSAVWPGTTPDASRTRALYRIASGEFTVILVGKDGDEKLRSHEPLALSTLLETIDAMPMRQDEMRRQPPR